MIVQLQAHSCAPLKTRRHGHYDGSTHDRPNEKGVQAYDCCAQTAGPLGLSGAGRTAFRTEGQGGCQCPTRANSRTKAPVLRHAIVR